MGQTGTKFLKATAIAAVAVGCGPFMPAIVICVFMLASAMSMIEPPDWANSIQVCLGVIIITYMMGWKTAVFSAVLAILWSYTRPLTLIAVLLIAILSSLVLDAFGNDISRVNMLPDAVAAGWAAICCWVLFGRLAKKYLPLSPTSR